jgi:hypothetical protein
MPWIVTRLCRDCIDTACVSVCPADCIYRYKGADKDSFPNPLFINPNECIDAIPPDRSVRRPDSLRLSFACPFVLAKRRGHWFRRIR